MNWLASLLTGGLVEKFTGPLLEAYKARVAAETSEQANEAEQTIRRIEAARDIAIAQSSDRWSATSVGRWLIVVPFGLWWLAIFVIQIVNPWFGLRLVVVAVPAEIMDMAKILIPAIVIADAGALVTKRLKR